MYVSVNWVIISSGNGFLPFQHQAITWTSAALLSIGRMCEIWCEICISEFYHFHSRKYIWKCCLPKWQPFHLGGGRSWWRTANSRDRISPVGGTTSEGRRGGTGTTGGTGWAGGFMGTAGADGKGGVGKGVRGSWMWTGGMHTGTYLRRILRLRNVTLPDPSTLMTYWSNCLTSVTRPVLSHFFGWGPVWFCRRT